MGDTATDFNVTRAWSEIPTLILGKFYGFQNIVMTPMYMRQQPSIPGTNDTGQLLLPFKVAILVKELSGIFVRMKEGNGVVVFNELVL